MNYAYSVDIAVVLYLIVVIIFFIKFKEIDGTLIYVFGMIISLFCYYMFLKSIKFYEHQLPHSNQIKHVNYLNESYFVEQTGKCYMDVYHKDLDTITQMMVIFAICYFVFFPIFYVVFKCCCTKCGMLNDYYTLSGPILGMLMFIGFGVCTVMVLNLYFHVSDIKTFCLTFIVFILSFSFPFDLFCCPVKLVEKIFPNLNIKGKEEGEEGSTQLLSTDSNEVNN